MAQTRPFEVDLTAKPETNVWRRTYIPVGADVSELKEVGNFTDAEMEVIKNTPFLASRIQAASQVFHPIGYNSYYQGKPVRLSFADARQAYNFAVNNPLEFLKSELPAYLATNDPDAAVAIVKGLTDAGLSTEDLNTLYENSLPEASKYAETSDEYLNRMAQKRGGGGPFGFVHDFLVPIATTAGALVGGPIGAAVGNSIAQLSKTGKIDPVQTAIAAGSAYVGQELFGGAPTTESVDYSLTAGGADVGGLGFKAPIGEVTGIQLAPEVVSEGLKIAAESLAPGLGTSIVPVNLGLGPQDYSLLGGTSPEQLAGMGETGLLSSAAGEGLQLPTVPALPSMGGGQGLSVPVSGGTVTETGFTPVEATPVLGDPGSFINDPNVLGQPVIQDIPVAPTLSIIDALRGANLANQLLGGGQQTATGFPQQQAPFQPMGVDYSGIYGLLGQRASVPGIASLLGPAQLRYPSLLG